MTPAAPSGVVTFLFTDIEGSTRRWEADAAAMRAALMAHDEVLRTAIEGHGGFLFSHTGDGVVAAFASPRSAVDAAITAQRALELPVRMGLATGEAELRDGDYFGTVLNRAARVMAAGHGGQILLADSTAVLLTGVDLLDLGPRRLRDVSAPVGVFQVRAPGLRAEFPSLRALDTSPGNLRPAITSLIGRDAEVSNLQAALRSHRLVTLAGVGGVGKTRLALEVATQLADEFIDGVWVFELAAVADPAAVPDAVAAVLGITQQPGKSVGESVASALEGRSRLLVFDNCEHVVDSVADLVAAILAASATVKVLATSREGIGVADELFWRVPSLDVGAAVELFVERAQSMVSDTLADEATAVEDVCRRLDGIPLAIELAASRMASMTAAEVRDRLDDRFKLLVGSRRGLERHQTLRHAVAWSYDLLGDAEKTVLERCSVFAGGFDLQSACAVVGPDAMTNMGLSLLRQDPPDLPGARAWLERAAEAGDTEAMWRLGALHVSKWDPPDLPTARSWYERGANAGDTEAMMGLARLLTDQWNPPDLIAARSWYEKAAESGNSDAMTGLGSLLTTRWDPPELSTARWWYEKAADAGNTEAMYNLGVLLTDYWNPPDLRKARAWYEKAAEAGHTVAMLNLGALLANRWMPPDFSTARSWYEKAAEGGNVSAMNNLGWLLTHRFDPPDMRAARSWWEKAAAAGDLRAMTSLAWLIAEMWDLPELSKARELAEKAANLRHTDAMSWLAFSFLRLSDPPDLTAARAWYEKAASTAEPQPMYDFGVFLAEFSVPPDLSAARSWLQRAADAGHLDAMGYLVLLASRPPGSV